MRLYFALSGSILYETDSEIVPPVGSTVRIQTECYRKGLNAGSIIDVPITANDPVIIDYTEPNGPVAYIDLNGYSVVTEGPDTDED